MSVSDLESRVAHLESKVQELLKSQDTKTQASDWRAAAGYFGNDRIMKRILEEALKYRKRDRRKAHNTPAKSRRAKS